MGEFNIFSYHLYHITNLRKKFTFSGQLSSWPETTLVLKALSKQKVIKAASATS